MFKIFEKMISEELNIQTNNLNINRLATIPPKFRIHVEIDAFVSPPF
jgi:hypothetical protein